MENGGWVGQGYVEFREQPAQVLTLSHTQNMELLGVLFSIALAKCHFMGQTSQELWVGFFFSFHKCFLEVMAGDPCNIIIFIYSKIFIGHLLCTTQSWKRSHCPLPNIPCHLPFFSVVLNNSYQWDQCLYNHICFTFW